MATVFTHAIVGVALSTYAPREIPRLRLALVLAVLAMLPDVDVIGFQLGISYGDALGHRGFTHSIVFALIIAVIAPSATFWRVSVFSRAWLWLAGSMFLATLSHGVLDAFTDAGLGVGFLIPFDNQRYFAPWRPLVTSPLGVAAFFDGPALRILGNELLWVGLPLLGWWLVRAVRSRLQ